MSMEYYDFVHDWRNLEDENGIYDQECKICGLLRSEIKKDLVDKSSLTEGDI